jgi:hypothetical protein
MAAEEGLDDLFGSGSEPEDNEEKEEEVKEEETKLEDNEEPSRNHSEEDREERKEIQYGPPIQLEYCQLPKPSPDAKVIKHSPPE